MKRKKTRSLLAALLVAIFCLSLAGCQSQEAILASQAAAEESRLAAEKAAEESRLAAEESRLAAEEAAAEAKRAETEQKIIEVLQWAPAVNGWSLTLAAAINGTFHQYKWNFESFNGSETVYKATFTGSFSPNPRDLPQLSSNGSITFLVDINNQTASVYSDPDDISSAFLLLALPY